MDSQDTVLGLQYKTWWSTLICNPIADEWTSKIEKTSAEIIRGCLYTRKQQSWINSRYTTAKNIRCEESHDRRYHGRNPRVFTRLCDTELSSLFIFAKMTNNYMTQTHQDWYFNLSGRQTRLAVLSILDWTKRHTQRNIRMNRKKNTSGIITYTSPQSVLLERLGLWHLIGEFVRFESFHRHSYHQF